MAMDITIPTIDESEIFVRVKAIGVGIQDGYFFPEHMQFPYPIGIEGSGIIEKIGEKVVDFKEGDRMAFISVLEPKVGVYAEYAVLGKNSVIVPIPREMSFTAAAAIAIQPKTSISSMRVVKDGGKLISVSRDQFIT